MGTVLLRANLTPETLRTEAEALHPNAAPFRCTDSLIQLDVRALAVRNVRTLKTTFKSGFCRTRFDVVTLAAKTM